MPTFAPMNMRKYNQDKANSSQASKDCFSQNKFCKNNVYINKVYVNKVMNFALLAILLGMSVGAGAAEGTAAVALPSDSSRVVDLDEVVVISQPKEHAVLRRQPVSSTVFSDTEMSMLHVKALNQLSSFVPSFVMPRYGSRLTSSVYVRGIGSRTGNPSVGLYYDHIPLVNKATFNQHFYDIDRVDVLRGPQGTLYGINAEGGLVRVFSKNPLTYQGTDLSLGVASGLATCAEIGHYQKLGEHSGYSVSAFYNGQKGFFHHQDFSDRADLSNEAGARLRLVCHPNEQLTADFIADYQYVNQNGFAYGLYDEDSGSWSDPTSSLMNGYKRQMVNTGLRLSYDFGSLLLSSSTGYQYLDDAMQMDQDYLRADLMRLGQDQKLNAVTQELTLRTKRSDLFWNHTSGLFFSHQWLHTDGPVTFGDDMNRMIVGGINASIKQGMVAGGMPEQAAEAVVNAMGMAMSGNRVPGTYRTPQLNLAAYHETSLKLSAALTATLGLRYDYQHQRIDYDTYSSFQLRFASRGQEVARQYLSALDGSTSADYHQLLPKFSLAWKLNASGDNIYATVSKGFRAGGYNLQMFSDIFRTEMADMNSSLMGMMKQDVTVEHTAEDYEEVNNTISYKPETCWNYELGTHLGLFSGSVRLDASVFFMQISNQQLSVLAGNYKYGRMMINAGRSNSCGGELSLRGVALGDRLSWAANYSFTHSTFRKYQDEETDRAGNVVTVDYRGRRVPFVPRHTMSAMADYRLPVASSCLRAVTFGANVTGTGSVYWDIANLHKQRFYALLGAHLAADFGTLTLDIWGQNLTCTRYNTFAVESAADGVSRLFTQRGNPIQLGVDLKVHF